MGGGFLDEVRKRFSSGCVNRAKIQDMQLKFLLCPRTSLISVGVKLYY